MNADQQNGDQLAAQECESLAACVARGQAAETFADIVDKIRGHADKLPADRKTYWTDQCKALGVTLYPQKKSPKPEAPSKP